MIEALESLAKLTSSLGLSTALSLFLVGWIILTLDKNLKKLLDEQQRTLDACKNVEENIIDALNKVVSCQKIQLTILKRLAKEKGIEVIGGDL